ncbi:hypothetical protein PYCCODRAFT_1401669 [Trametes coccinea BRFM310]|uniref:Uncharacterized protein n=1 Tax=Trametes coccinea (strain BRFM310) TaxID=1353009 RepID=A0A1Y2J2S5_TRAC3|nr:hypothetical protein PYCCODRAFT_1401669 [Trametes coccinea BRFM310]
MSGSFDNTSSSTGTNSEFTQGPGGGTHSEGFNQGQGQGGAYDELQSSQSNDMGGGQGAMGSGVAGGYEGNQQSQQPQQSGTEKKDWLDKGIEAIGKKAGINISDKNADTAGDFINKEFDKETGRKLPSVY